MHPNLAKQRLKEGRLALGLGLRQARTVDIASAAATCGFDWLFIDMEHNAMSVDAAAQIAAAAPAMGVTPIVRVPGHEHYHATRLLDNGAQRPPIGASSTPAAGTASIPAWAACTIRRTWKSMSAWACASSWADRTCRC